MEYYIKWVQTTIKLWTVHTAELLPRFRLGFSSALESQGLVVLGSDSVGELLTLCRGFQSTSTRASADCVLAYG